MVRGLLALVVLCGALFVACSDSEPKPPSPTPTTGVTASPTPVPPRLNHCPEDAGAEICAFGAAAEGWVQAGDVIPLTGGGPLDTDHARADITQLIASALPADANDPRKLRSIGCPYVPGQPPYPDCSERFALVFSTIQLEDAGNDPAGMLTFAYTRTPGGPQLTGYGIPATGHQIALLAGPMTGGDILPGSPELGLGFRIYPVEVLPPGGTPATPPAGLEQIGGIDVRELTLGPETSLPDDLAVYLGPAPWAADSFPILLWRVYRGHDGTIRRDDLFANAKAQFGPLAIVGWAASESFGEIVFVACQEGRCRGVAVGGWEGEFDVYRSTDGGITWSAFGQVSAMTFPRAVTPAGVIMAEWQGRDAAERPVFRFFLHPSGKEVAPPVPYTEPRLVPGIGVVWEPAYQDRKFGAEPVYDASGAAIATAQPDPNLEARLAARIADGTLYGVWNYVPDRPADPHPRTAYLGQVDAAGRPVALFTPQRVATWNGPYFAGAGLLLGNVELPVPAGSATPFDVPAAFIDLSTGRVLPLRELDEGLETNQQPLVRGAALGRVARVATGSDCLHVRESPSASASSLGCYRDGVLLFERGETHIEGATTWVAVTAPDGQDGWASAEFLQRRPG
ncbi:MAG: hypothetical protein IH609_11450 [Dehalococcoidia bacterium]|nr:hypothetical protein [Dehalococcoidia bacterium]